MKYAIKKRNKNIYFAGFVNDQGGEKWVSDISKAKPYSRLDARSQALLMSYNGGDVRESPVRIN